MLTGRPAALMTRFQLCLGGAENAGLEKAELENAGS